MCLSHAKIKIPYGGAVKEMFTGSFTEEFKKVALNFNTSFISAVSQNYWPTRK